MPLRVVHVIRSLDPAAGGPPVVCARLAEAQRACGHAVKIVAEGPGLTGGPRATDRGVEVRLVALPGRWRIGSRSVAARRELAEHCRGADVLHLHGVWDALLHCATVEAWASGVPYVVAPHGMLDPWSLGQKKWKKRLALALGTRRVLDRAAVLHLLNPDERDLLRPLGLAARQAVVPNGIDLAEVGDPGPLGSPLPVADRGRPYVLFLGRLHYKKGLDLLVEAFALIAAKHPALLLVVAGPDDGEKHNLEASVRDRNLSARVRLVGPLYGGAKWAALAGAACFCLPSRQEGFSIAILEALACRRPVVISENCHFPEVGESGAGFVVPLEPGAVAAAIGRVLSDPTAAAAMGEAGRELVEARYTWEKVAGQCDRMYADAGVVARPVAV